MNILSRGVTEYSYKMLKMIFWVTFDTSWVVVCDPIMPNRD